MTPAELAGLSPTLTDLHVHTHYCDGRDTPADMVEAALSQGLTTVGILAHSYVSFDEDCRIEIEDLPRMTDELNELKSRYGKKICVLQGIEADYYAEMELDGFDYIIGSVHYFNRGGEYLPIDLSADSLQRTVDEKFGGDFYSAVEEYYRLVSDIVRKTGAQIVGHLDLITKFNKGNALFDTHHPRYVKAYRSAVDALIGSGAIFEINMGAMSRGYTDEPYPSREIIDYIKECGGVLMLSSDAHRREHIAYAYGKARELL